MLYTNKIVEEINTGVYELHIPVMVQKNKTIQNHITNVFMFEIVKLVVPNMSHIYNPFFKVTDTELFITPPPPPSPFLLHPQPTLLYNRE